MGHGAMTYPDIAPMRPNLAGPRCLGCAPREGSFCGDTLGAPGNPFGPGGQPFPQIEAGAAIYREGDPALHLFTIAQGAVKLFKLLGDGRRQIVCFLFKGDLFGLASDGGYAHSAEALGPISLCRFPRRADAGPGDGLPGLEKSLVAALTRNLVEAHDQMLLLGRKTAREKVATFLLALARRVEPESDGTFPLPMSRADIADYLGLTVETVSRQVSRFRQEGLIFVPGPAHIVIADAARLARLAEGL